MPKTEKVKSPYECAEEVLHQFSIKSIPSPVEKIAKALGAQVRFAAFDDELSGMVHIKDGVAIIGINALHHPNRQRFTIAHELGHLQLHRDMITSAVHVDKEFPALMRDANSATGMERVEIEANQFAAALLMPRPMILQVLAGSQFDIDDEGPLDELAKKFRVSKQALDYRIRNLNRQP
jgi:Zn-dependent peptidase ImmA (M78 family)